MHPLTGSHLSVTHCPTFFLTYHLFIHWIQSAFISLFLCFTSMLWFYWTAVCFVTEINHNRVCMCKPEPPVNTSTVCQFRQFLTPAKWRSYLRIQTVLVRLYLQYTWIIELEFEQVKSARTASTVFNLSVGASLVILRTVFVFVYQWCSMTFS